MTHRFAFFPRAFTYLSHTIPDFTDNCLINFMKCGEDFYVTTETNYIRKINPQTLETLEKVSVNLSSASVFDSRQEPLKGRPYGLQELMAFTLDSTLF